MWCANMTPIKPLGTDVKELTTPTSGPVYGGYRVAKDGVPTFLYKEDGKPVEDTLVPAKDGKSFTRVLKVNGTETKEAVSW